MANTQPPQGGPGGIFVPMPNFQKPEGTIGNVLEFLLTYGFGIIWGLVNLFLVFGWVEFTTAQERADFWGWYNYFTGFYLTTQFVGAIIGTQARFSKGFRIGLDTAASMFNLILPVGVFFLAGIAKTFDPQGLDMDITIQSTMWTLLDVLGIGLLQYTAIRRVEEIYGERR